MDRKTYFAFLSYSHADRKWAKWLHHSLETYRVPSHLVGKRTPAGSVPKRLTPVFRDQDELSSAPDLTGHIKQALDKSQNLILICSPGSAQSRWVNKEIETFKRLGRSDRIFCIIVDGDPASEDGENQCFAPALRARYDSDGNPQPGEVEPIAADVRKFGDGRGLARLKIISGLLGIGLDELRQRELQRRNRRMVAITSASLIGLVITAVLAISAYMARDEANQRRTQAENLLSFMVGDLRDSLEPIGHLGLLEQVGVKAMDYFATIKSGHLTDEELLSHAQILTQLGEIRMSQRQYKDALASFTEAYERSAELSSNNPSNGEHLFGRGQAEFWVGYVHWRRGDFSAARDWLVRYRDSSQLLFELDPERDDWSREVAYGDHNLAVLAWESDDLDQAEAGFKRELQALLELQKRDAGADLQRDLADTVSWLGNVALRQGDLGNASNYFKSSSESLRLLLLQEPDNADRKHDWASAIQLVVEVDLWTGDINGAETLTNQVMAVFDELAAQDEENRVWVRSSSEGWILKGKVLTAHGELEAARRYAEKSVSLLELLVKEEPSDLASQEVLADAYSLSAWISASEGRISASLASNLKALDIMQHLQGASSLNDDRLGKLASIMVSLGQSHMDLGDYEQAHTIWRKAGEILEDKAATVSTPLLLDPFARVLMLSGKTGEAEKVMEKLEINAYRPLISWPAVTG